MYIYFIIIVLLLYLIVPRKHNASTPTASGTLTIYFLGPDASEEFLSKNLIIKSQEMDSCIYTKTILTAFLFLSSFSDSLNQRINPIRYTVRWTNKMRPFGSSSSVSRYLLPSYGPPSSLSIKNLNSGNGCGPSIF
jgi:hypothetical protein